MIIRPSGSDLYLITQPDHAQLAADILTGWVAEDFPHWPTRDAVLFATAQHDIGWDAEDAAPRANPETGNPYDFISIPLAIRQGIWPRAVARLAAQSTYAAALVAQHGITVYRRYREQPEWRWFFEEMERLRDRWFHADEDSTFTPSAIDPPSEQRQHFLQDYGWLALGDLLSLIFCNDWATTTEIDSYRAILQGERLLITPDPFAGREVSMRVRARVLRAQPFANDASLREAFRSAPVELLTGIVTGDRPPPV